MKPRRLIIASILTLIALGVGSYVVAINRAIEARHGPVHRFRVAADPALLTDEEAGRLAREVMTRDGYPEAAWRMMEDDRSKAPDGRPDRFLCRNADNPNHGVVAIHCEEPPGGARFVRLEMSNGEVTGQGTLGK